MEPELRTLMLACLAGSEPATAMLLSRLDMLLRTYFRDRLRRLGRAPAEAKDLVQEILISIHTHRHAYDTSQPLSPWVFAIARYKLIDYLRRTEVAANAVALDEVLDLPAQENTDAVEDRLDLRTLIARLTPKMRRAIELVKVHGLSVSEAAEMTNMSESAIKGSVHRGLKALAKLAGWQRTTIRAPGSTRRRGPAKRSRVARSSRPGEIKSGNGET